jgi:hypothetical protein
LGYCDQLGREQFLNEAVDVSLCPIRADVVLADDALRDGIKVMI